MKNLSFLIVFLVLSLGAHAVRTSLIAPVKIPIFLTGNFAELRANHFHGGIDIRTNGKIGLPVYAIEKGYVSRVAVSGSGFGRVVYVTHPNGYTSVYAHLDRFFPELEKWIRSEQYRQKIFSLNLYPERNQFVINQGQEIARSGNTGSSGGPHLHFEVRETATEKPINPLSLNLKITDTKAPTVSVLRIYPLSDVSQISGNIEAKSFDCILTEGVYRIKENPTLTGFGKLAFGVDAIDYLDGSWSKCGVYKIKIWVDSTLIYAFQMDKLDYNQMRYLNSHIDYKLAYLTGKRIHKNYIEPGNRLDIYERNAYNGVYDFSDGRLHQVTYHVEDYAGNRSVLKFQIQSGSAKKHEQKKSMQHFDYDRVNEYETDFFKLNVPRGSLYDNMDFNYKTLPKQPNTFSELHVVGNETIPIHNACSIAIKANQLPERLRDKVLIGRYQSKTKKFESVGGSYRFGWVEAQVRAFGSYVILADTIAPVIRSLSIDSASKLTDPDKIVFKISDDLSGIATFNGYIDDQWVLFEFDSKTNNITYSFDEFMKRGKNHQLKLEVVDAVGNRKLYESQFYK